MKDSNKGKAAMGAAAIGSAAIAAALLYVSRRARNSPRGRKKERQHDPIPSGEPPETD